MNETFIRTAQLLGDQGFSRLSSSVVAVFGLGGVGSHCAEALARSGVGTLFFIDSDTVAPSNINRQSIALLSTVGQKKTDVMKEKIADINPECSVFTSSAFVLPENLREVFSSCPVKPDYIIDAIDTVSASWPWSPMPGKRGSPSCRPWAPETSSIRRPSASGISTPPASAPCAGSCAGN